MSDDNAQLASVGDVASEFFASWDMELKGWYSKRSIEA